MLAWTIYLSFAGALACLLTPRENPRATRAVAFGTALAGLMCALIGAVQFKPENGLEVITNVRWIPALGIDFSLAADGISVTLVLLTGIAAVAGVLFSGMSNIGPTSSSPSSSRSSAVSMACS